MENSEAINNKAGVETEVETNDNVEVEAQEKIFTQSDLDSKIGERLSREKAKFEQLSNEFEDFKKTVGDVEELHSTIDSLSKEKETLLNDKDTLNTELLRYKVAFDNGLDTDSIDLLVGDSEEELVRKASKIKSLRGANTTNYTSKKDYSSVEKDNNDIYRQLLKKL